MDEKLYISKKINLSNIVWIVFICELIIFFNITYFYLSPEETRRSNIDNNIGILYLSYLIVIISIPLIYGIYNRAKKKIKNDDPSKEKTDKYLFVVISKFAILEVAAILTLIAFYLNGIKEPLYMFGIVFVAALLNKPSLKQLKKDFLDFKDDAAVEEIVYMPDEIENTEEEKDNPA